MKPETIMRGRLETSLEETYFLSLTGSGIRFTGNLMDAESILSSLKGFSVAAENSMALYLASPLPLPKLQEHQYLLMLGTHTFEENMMAGYLLSQRRPFLTPAISTLRNAYGLLSRFGQDNRDAGSYLERLHIQIKSSFLTERVSLYWEDWTHEH